MQTVRSLLAVLAVFAWPGAASAQEMGINEQNQAYFRLTAGGVTIQKVAESNGDFTLRLRNAAELVVLDVRHEKLVELSVNGRTTRLNLQSLQGDPRKLTELRVLVASSSAIDAYRSIAAAVESKALEDVDANLSVAEETLLLDGAFVASLGGDRAAARRHFTRLARKHRLIRVRQTRDCVGDYVTFVNWAFNLYQKCQEEAMKTGWPYYPALLFGCTTMYYARTQSAWWQMIACSAVPV